MGGGQGLDTVQFHEKMAKQSCRDGVFSLRFHLSSEMGRTHCCLLRHVGNILFAKHPNTPMICKEEGGVIAAMTEFDRELALSSRK